MRGHQAKTKVAAITLAIILMLLQTPFSVLADTEIRLGTSGPSLGNSGEIVEFKMLEEDVRLQNVAPGTPLEDLNLPDQLEVTAIVDEEEVEGYINVLEWVCDKEYDPELIGVYFFSPEISSGWVLADYAVKPKITVTIYPVMAASASVEIWDGNIATGFAGGDGSEGNPYLISNGAELAYLAQESNNGNNYSGKYFELISDIYLNRDNSYVNEWTPIGYASRYFSGILDGNNKTIYGLFINSPNSDYQGLIGSMYGQAKDLGIANSSVTGKDYVGALAGYTKYNYFNNIYVSNNEINGTKHVGGVTGAGEFVYDFNKISNLSGSVNGKDRVGGISGGIFRKSGDYNIDSIYNNANVIASGSYTGGVFGVMVEGYLNNSINQGNIIGNSTSGGLVGTTFPGSYIGDYKFINCENYGSITGSTTGGIAGNTYNSSDHTKLKIIQCNNWGEITGTSYTGGIVGGCTDVIEDCINNGPVNGISYGRAGGIAGLFHGSAIRCYNLGTISGIERVGGIVGDKGIRGKISNCGNIGGVTGSRYVGGLAGYYTSGGSISQSYNTGNVEGTGTGNVGGLIGQNYSPISDCYSTGNVRGADYVGGLVGYNGTTTIINSYSSGKVIGTGRRVGGFIGYLYVTLTTNILNSYYLESAHTNDIGDSGNNVVSGLSPISDFHLRLLAPTLGEAFTTDTEYVNKGFPVLVGLDYFDPDDGEYKWDYFFKGEDEQYKFGYWYFGYVKSNGEIHYGIDVITPYNTNTSSPDYGEPTVDVDIYSVADGTIKYAGLYSTSGYMVAKSVENGTYTTRYLHMQAGSITDEVFNAYSSGNGFIASGTRLGLVGNTGSSGVAHIHFDVNTADEYDGKQITLNYPEHWIDPEPFFPHIEFEYSRQTRSMAYESEGLHSEGCCDDNVYFDPELYIDIALIRHVGEIEFDQWAKSIGYENVTVTLFKEHYDIDDEYFNELLADFSIMEVYDAA